MALLPFMASFDGFSRILTCRKMSSCFHIWYLSLCFSSGFSMILRVPVERWHLSFCFSPRSSIILPVLCSKTVSLFCLQHLSLYFSSRFSIIFTVLVKRCNFSLIFDTFRSVSHLGFLSRRIVCGHWCFLIKIWCFFFDLHHLNCFFLWVVCSWNWVITASVYHAKNPLRS